MGKSVIHGLTCGAFAFLLTSRHSSTGSFFQAQKKQKIKGNPPVGRQVLIAPRVFPGLRHSKAGALFGFFTGKKINQFIASPLSGLIRCLTCGAGRYLLQAQRYFVPESLQEKNSAIIFGVYSQPTALGKFYFIFSFGKPFLFQSA